MKSKRDTAYLSPCEQSMTLLSSWSRSEKGGSTWITSSVWGCCNANVCTGQSRFLLSNCFFFFLIHASVYWQTNGHNLAHCSNCEAIIQIGDQKRPLKHRNKAFSWCPANVWVRMNKIWPKWKKKFIYKVLVGALEQTQDFLPFFPDFISVFQTFSRSGKLLGKFQDFFKNSRLCMKPVHHSNMPPMVKKNLTPFMQSLSWLCQNQARESKILLAGCRSIDLSIQVNKETNLVA